MTEILYQIEMEALDSKVPMFSSVIITSRHKHLESEINVQDKFCAFSKHRKQDTKYQRYILC